MCVPLPEGSGGAVDVGVKIVRNALNLAPQDAPWKTCNLTHTKKVEANRGGSKDGSTVADPIVDGVGKKEWLS